MPRFLIAAGAAALSFLGLAPVAQALDVSGTVLCVAEEAVQCVAGADCQRSSDVETFDLPPNLTVDFTRYVVMAPGEDGSVTASKMRTVAREGERMIVQDFEVGFGWTLLIDVNDGRMSIAISEDEAGLVAFGKCSEL